MQKIEVDKKKLLDGLLKKVTESELKVEVDDNEFVTLRIRGASLNDHIEANEIYTKSNAQFAIFFNEINNGNSIHENIKEMLKKPDVSELNSKTLFEIGLFQRCVVEPEFSLEEIVEISNKKPNIINDVCNEILSLTS